MDVRKKLFQDEQDLFDRKARCGIQETWRNRMNESSISQIDFCKKYNINPAWFSRIVNMKILASEKTFTDIECAFKKENI